MRPIGALSLLVIISIGSAGCRQRDEKNGPMPQPSKAPPKGAGVDTGINLADQKAEEAWPKARFLLLQQALPSFSDFQPITALAKVKRSPVAHMTLCSDLKIKLASEALVKQFKEAKWAPAQFQSLRKNDARIIFNVKTASFKANAMLSKDNSESCSNKNGKTRIYLTFTQISDGPNGKETTATLTPVIAPKATLFHDPGTSSKRPKIEKSPKKNYNTPATKNTDKAVHPSKG